MAIIHCFQESCFQAVKRKNLFNLTYFQLWLLQANTFSDTLLEVFAGYSSGPNNSEVLSVPKVIFLQAAEFSG